MTNIRSSRCERAHRGSCAWKNWHKRACISVWRRLTQFGNHTSSAIVPRRCVNGIRCTRNSTMSVYNTWRNRYGNFWVIHSNLGTVLNQFGILEVSSLKQVYNEVLCSPWFRVESRRDREHSHPFIASCPSGPFPTLLLQYSICNVISLIPLLQWRNLSTIIALVACVGSQY